MRDAPHSLGTSVGEGLRYCTTLVVVPISTTCFSSGVALLPAPKSRLCPEPAPLPGQGTPCQRLPPAPDRSRQVDAQVLPCPVRLFRGAQPHTVAGCSWGPHHLVPSIFLGSLLTPSFLSPPHLPSPGRKGSSGPRRSLSVEDIGVPGRLRAVGRVVEVFPDGTSQLELQRPPHGAFGFCVTSGHGRPDTGTVGLSQSVT